MRKILTLTALLAATLTAAVNLLRTQWDQA